MYLVIFIKSNIMHTVVHINCKLYLIAKCFRNLGVCKARDHRKDKPSLVSYVLLFNLSEGEKNDFVLPHYLCHEVRGNNLLEMEEKKTNLEGLAEFPFEQVFSVEVYS